MGGSDDEVVLHQSVQGKSDPSGGWGLGDVMGAHHNDEQCCLAEPGHHLLTADYHVGFSETTVGVDVTASVRDDEVIELRGADSMVRGWNHRVGEIIAALQRFGNAAEWIPDRCALIVPPRWLGTVHVMFSVARFDEWTECQT